jgi:hypothetical protein
MVSEGKTTISNMFTLKQGNLCLSPFAYMTCNWLILSG